MDPYINYTDDRITIISNALRLLLEWTNFQMKGVIDVIISAVSYIWVYVQQCTAMMDAFLLEGTWPEERLVS